MQDILLIILNKFIPYFSKFYWMIYEFYKFRWFYKDFLKTKGLICESLKLPGAFV
jgi:hypothetical protein